jgi:hypothetical protein
MRRTSKKYRGKSYFNYVLVESQSTPKGPPQKTVCSLGSLEPAPHAWRRRRDRRRRTQPHQDQHGKARHPGQKRECDTHW